MVSAPWMVNQVVASFSTSTHLPAALRSAAAAVEDVFVTEVAARFDTSRQPSNMISRFNRNYAEVFPLFRRLLRIPCRAGAAVKIRTAPEPAIADQRELDLVESGRSLQTRNAGIFLFLPLLVKLRFDRMTIRTGLSQFEDGSGLQCLSGPDASNSSTRNGEVTSTTSSMKPRFVSSALNVLPRPSCLPTTSIARREHQRVYSGAW